MKIKKITFGNDIIWHLALIFFSSQVVYFLTSEIFSVFSKEYVISNILITYPVILLALFIGVYFYFKKSLGTYGLVNVLIFILFAALSMYAGIFFTVIGAVMLSELPILIGGIVFIILFITSLCTLIVRVSFQQYISLLLMGINVLVFSLPFIESTLPSNEYESLLIYTIACLFLGGACGWILSNSSKPKNKLVILSISILVSVLLINTL